MAFFACLIINLPLSLRGDTFYLRNGKALDGVLESRTGGVLKIRTSRGLFAVPEAEIASVERGAGVNQIDIQIADVERLIKLDKLDEAQKIVDVLQGRLDLTPQQKQRLTAVADSIRQKQSAAIQQTDQDVVAAARKHLESLNVPGAEQVLLDALAKGVAGPSTCDMLIELYSHHPVDRLKLLNTLARTVDVGPAERRQRVREQLAKVCIQEAISGSYAKHEEKRLSLLALAALSMGPSIIPSSTILPESEWRTLTGTTYAFSVACQNPLTWLTALEKPGDEADLSAIAATCLAVVSRSVTNDSPLPPHLLNRFSDFTRLRNLLVVAAQGKLRHWSAREQDMLRRAVAVHAVRVLTDNTKGASPDAWPHDAIMALATGSTLVEAINWDLWGKAPLAAVVVKPNESALLSDNPTELSDEALRWGIQIAMAPGASPAITVLLSPCRTALIARNPNDPIAKSAMCLYVKEELVTYTKRLASGDDPNKVQTEARDLPRLVELYGCDESIRAELVKFAQSLRRELDAFDFLANAAKNIAKAETKTEIDEILAEVDREAEKYAGTVQIRNMNQLKEVAARIRQLMSRTVDIENVLICFEKDVYDQAIHDMLAQLRAMDKSGREYEIPTLIWARPADFLLRKLTIIDKLDINERISAIKNKRAESGDEVESGALMSRTSDMRLRPVGVSSIDEALQAELVAAEATDKAIARLARHGAQLTKNELEVELYCLSKIVDEEATQLGDLSVCIDKYNNDVGDELSLDESDKNVDIVSRFVRLRCDVLTSARAVSNGAMDAIAQYQALAEQAYAALRQMTE